MFIVGDVQLVIVMPAASMRDEMIAPVIDASGGSLTFLQTDMVIIHVSTA